MSQIPLNYHVGFQPLSSVPPPKPKRLDGTGSWIVGDTLYVSNIQCYYTHTVSPINYLWDHRHIIMILNPFLSIAAYMDTSL